MSHELLYTSAPRGLKPGSRGFCTVACTQGMSAPLVSALESLCAYRHVFPPGSANASDNPVVWSHIKLQSAGRSYHVLSRVSDYGLDYSERTNKLAHHVALEARELTVGGPAWLLQQPGFMESAWEGEPRLLSSGRPTRQGAPSAAICTAWQKVTGDAGWAGVLAEAFLANAERQVYILFKPGMDLLPLIAEAIGLLPAERRWELTFSTYFTTLPPGVVCNWRCILADSPEANQSRRFVQALRIDLCNPLQPAVGGPLVEAARTGVRRIVGGSSAPPVTQGPNNEWSDDDLAQELELQPVDDFSPGSPPTPGGIVFREHVPSPTGADYGVAGAPAVPPGMPPPPPGKGRRKLEQLYADDMRRQRRWLPLKITVVVVLLICIGVGIWKGPTLVARLRRAPEFEEVALSKNAGGGKSKSNGAKVTDETSYPRAETSPENNGGNAVLQAPSAPDTSKPNEKVSDTQPHPPDSGSNPVSPSKENEVPPKSNPTDLASADKGRKTHAAQNDSGAPGKPAASTAGTSEPNGTSPDSRAERSPTYSKGTVTRVSDDPHTFTLFALDAINDGILKIPLPDPLNAKWNLHLPAEFKRVFNVSAMRPGSKEDALSLTMTKGLGEDRAIFRIERADDDEGAACLQLKMTELDNQSDSWVAIRWCVVSVTGGGNGVQLFALQREVIKNETTPTSGGFGTSMTIPNAVDGLPIPKIQVKELVLTLGDGETAFPFEPPGKPGALEMETILSIPTLSDFAQKAVRSDKEDAVHLYVNQTKLALSFDLFGRGKGSARMISLTEKFRRYVVGTLRRDDLAVLSDFTWPTDHPDKFVSAIPKQLAENNPEKLVALKKSLDEYVVALSKQGDGNQAKIGVAKSLLAKIDQLAKAAQTFSDFKRGVERPRIRRAKLYYDVPLPADVTAAAVRIPLEFAGDLKK